MAPIVGGKTHALAAFHHAVSKGDIEKVKVFVQVLPRPSTCSLTCEHFECSGAPQGFFVLLV